MRSKTAITTVLPAVAPSARAWPRWYVHWLDLTSE